MSGLVGTGGAAIEPVPARPGMCTHCTHPEGQQEAVAIVAIHKAIGRIVTNADPAQTYPEQVCGFCLSEMAYIAGIPLR